MIKTIKGKVFVLGNNIDTDQIIPAEHLVYSISDPEEKKMYGKYALSAVPAEESGLPTGGISFVQPDKFTSEYSIIIAGKNFGCGSSREHAPLSLQMAGVQVVIAESFARIFYRNSVDGGFIIPLEVPRPIIEEVKTGDEIIIDLQDYMFYNFTTDESFKLNSPGDVLPIIEAGGLFNYAQTLKTI